MKSKIKIILDLLMTAILPMLMAFQITGQYLHEWLGPGMILLFLIHNILNVRWYKNLFRGKYTVLRVVHTVVNIAVLVSMLCLAYSGIRMSGYVFSFLSFDGSMALARQMHMAASYQGFVLMSVHAGMHYGMVVGMAGKVARKHRMPKGARWGARIVAILIACYGAICFYQADILSYMLLKNQFAFFDFEKSAVLVFTEYAAMMGFWIFISYYLGKRSSLPDDMKKWLEQNGVSHQ